MMIQAPITRALAMLSIGKLLALLIIPFTVSLAYGKVQSSKRHDAEQQVQRLTVDITTLSRSLAHAEKFIQSTEDRAIEHGQRQVILANEKADVLDTIAPNSVVAILRIMGTENTGP